MWTFLLLYLLGQTFCQIDGLDSTQMYSVKLKIESGVIPNLTDILQPFMIGSNLTVDNIQMTTTCKSASNGSLSCTCGRGHMWSQKVCKSHPKCCGGKECDFLKESNPTCVSNSTVSVNGSFVLEDIQYSDCLNKKDSDEFKACNDKLLQKMKAEYSTIRGFEKLTITKYRVGSVIADFEILFAMSFEPQELIERSTSLSKKLQSTCFLNTTGVVQLSMPQNPVYHSSQHELICAVKHKLDASVTWKLQRDDREFIITTGTESEVKIETLKTTIELRNTSELWAGEYTCLYHQKSGSCNITHKASGEMDVCRKPNIYISVEPSFPRCTNSSSLLNVKVKCEIEESNETYSVAWSGSSTKDIKPRPDEQGVYSAITAVSCNEPEPKLVCTFMNRCNQNTRASIDIHMIKAHDKFCKAEADWQVTKAGYTARLRCEGEPGIRQRECKAGSSEGEWEPEDSACVNKDLHVLLHQASIADIGLGSLDKNAEEVFSRLERVTNNTEKINTHSNLNASVSVFHTLSKKLSKQQDIMVDDFLGSSSNVLEKSLQEFWDGDEDKDNTSLAERYLISVEQIMHVTNIKQPYLKKNVEVDSHNCSKELTCVNKVFNTTVNLEGLDPGSVVTAGFKELEHYLPNNYEDFKPNSFVISTTTEKNISDSVKVKIHFALLKPRPSNVRMICAAWDDKTKGWSTHKCKWTGSEGVCVCEHLSSFCILMGKSPLKVKGLTELTYVALSVSIVSLIISLVIELVVWSAVVKTSTSYLRHTAHVNISLCLLVADCCVLASSKPEELSQVWCKTLVVLKHFCFLAMFFWMLWLSSTLLHQTVFLFHNVSKKNYLRLSVLIGYVCPLLIVAITFIANRAGAEGQYYSKETCWLVYTAPFKGSIHTFVIPVGIIAFFNMFAMLVVIMKLLDHPKTVSAHEKEKKAIVTVMRTVVLLTPVFGVTWLLGFAVMFTDLTYGLLADCVNYAFTLLNAFQGLFILLTICLGDITTREELLRRLKLKASAPPSDSCTDSTVKK